MFILKAMNRLKRLRFYWGTRYDTSLLIANILNPPDLTSCASERVINLQRLNGKYNLSLLLCTDINYYLKGCSVHQTLCLEQK